MSMVQWLVEDNLNGARCAGVRFDCGWLVDLMLNVNTAEGEQLASRHL
jgi:hypothetical protein